MKKQISIILGMALFSTCVYLVSSELARRSKYMMYEQEILSAKVVKADFSSPEGAILCLENAYRRRDLESAIACKDFKSEAKIMMNGVVDERSGTGDIVEIVADSLRSAYVVEIQGKWPDFKDVTSYFVASDKCDSGQVIVTEICKYPNDNYSRQRINVVKTDNGWRVLNVVKEPK